MDAISIFIYNYIFISYIQILVGREKDWSSLEQIPDHGKTKAELKRRIVSQGWPGGMSSVRDLRAVFSALFSLMKNLSIVSRVY